MSQTIMVVDDDETLLRLIQALLRRDGYSTQAATSAEQALEMLVYQTPDLFVIDTSLPGISGFQLCQTLREQARTAHVPILLTSTWFDCEAIWHGQRVGATDFLEKAALPFNMLAKVRSSLASGVANVR